MSECTCIVECSRCVQIARLTRERDEAREEAHEATQLLARKAKIDPLHPNGRCRCAGEGQCEWCQRTEARDELDGIAEVLDAAGVPQVTDGPDGRRWTLGLGARVEHVIAERDDARASLERLRDAAFTECEVVKCGWSHDERHCSLHGVWFKSGEDAAECPVGQHARKVLAAGGHDWPEALEAAAAALAGEGEAKRCAWTQDDEGVWHTACRSSWLYPDGGSPADHGQVYCHACGQRVEAEPHAEGEDEEPAPELPEVKGGRDA